MSVVLTNEWPQLQCRKSHSNFTRLSRSGLGFDRTDTRRRSIITLSLLLKSTFTAFQRQINVDRVSFDGGVGWRESRPRIGPHLRQWYAKPYLSSWFESDSMATTFKADSYKRCFRYLDCFDGGLVRHIGQLAKLSEIERATFKAVYLSSQFDRITQTRMPEGLKLMDKQTQALSTPDNLVGGAVMRTIPICRMEYLTTL